MTEDDTFNALRRKPWLDAFEIWHVMMLNDSDNFDEEFLRLTGWIISDFWAYHPTK